MEAELKPSCCHRDEMRVLIVDTIEIKYSLAQIYFIRHSISRRYMNNILMLVLVFDSAIRSHTSI